MKNFNFKKKLGQNFLNNKIIPQKIANCIEYKKRSLVIEIGPGAGALTLEVLPLVDAAILYEVDKSLENILEEKLKNFNNYNIIFDDFLNRNINDDLKEYNFDNLYIVANLPYYITTPIITKIIKDNLPVKEVVIMVQKEVADRFSASVDSREYGQITVYLNYFFNIKKMFDVSRNNFIPKPNVDSSVIKMVKKDNIEKLNNYEHFQNLLKDSFQYKRKTIRNNLKKYDLNKVEKILKKYGYDLNVRSECLPYQFFVELSNELVND